MVALGQREVMMTMDEVVRCSWYDWGWGMGSDWQAQTSPAFVGGREATGVRSGFWGYGIMGLCPLTFVSTAVVAR